MKRREMQRSKGGEEPSAAKRVQRRGGEACRTDGALIKNSAYKRLRFRQCVACKQVGAQSEMIRLTADYHANEVHFNPVASPGKAKLHGRSAYLCPANACLEGALKGTRLKFALEGRRPKGTIGKRSIKWPLEPQLIKLITDKCTEP